MTKEEQEKIYKFIGRELTKARERKNITITQLANEAGEQFNTIKAMEEGRPFHFHQAIWVKEVLGINLGIMIVDAYNANNIQKTFKGDSNGEEKTEIKTTNIETTSSYSDFI